VPTYKKCPFKSLSVYFLSIILLTYLFPFKHHFFLSFCVHSSLFFPVSFPNSFSLFSFVFFQFSYHLYPIKKTICLFSFSLCVSFQITDSLFPMKCLSVDFVSNIFIIYMAFQFPFPSVHQTCISLYSYLNVFLSLDITVPFLLSFFLSFSLLQFSLNIPRYLHSLI
jgi:hypothetical protein